MPEREQVLAALSTAGAFCGECGFEPGETGCADCVRVRELYADAVMPVIDGLRFESEQRLGELLFWEFEYRAAMDNYLGEAHEVKRLRSELARERRERDEAVERAQERMEKAIAATLARKKAEAKVHAIAQVRVWKNEDGKGFLFADDVRAALDLAVPAAGEATR
jgi:hypothetical protein